MTTTPPRPDDGRVVARRDERTLVLEGDVDLSAVEAFDRSRDDDLAWVRTIDVSAVSFVDTQGLGLMLRVAAPRGREAPSSRPALLGASPQVQQLLQMLGVDALFELRPSADEVDGHGVDGAITLDGARPLDRAQALDGASVLDGARTIDTASALDRAPSADGHRPTA